MNWFLRIGAGSLLALSLVATAAAAPAGSTAASAKPLPESLSASGTIAGDSAGSYQYYTFNYPGDGSTGTITLNVAPTDPTVGNAVGLNLYQDGTQLASMNALSPTPGTNFAIFSSTTRAPVLVQVYNYDQGATASYNFAITGVTESTPAATAPASATPAPASATTAPAATKEAAGTESDPIPLTAGKTLSGTLAGDGGGSYVYYTIDYAGDGSTQTVTVNYSPTGIDVGNGVSVSVYQDGTTLNSESGSASSQPGTLEVGYTSLTKGPVLIQIANYNPSPTISYNISD